MQGFNITSYESLNNLILILNREFQCEFNLDFSSSDHENLIQSSNLENISKQRDIEDIDFIQYEFLPKIGIRDEEIPLKENSLALIEDYFNNKGIECRKDNSERLHLHGMLIYYPNKSSDLKLNFQLDPFMYDINRIFVEELGHVLYGKNIKVHWCRVYFDESKTLLTQDFKLSSRLYNVGVKMADKHILYELNNLKFNLDTDSRKMLNKLLLGILFFFNSPHSLKICP